MFSTLFFSAVYNQERLISDNLCTKQGNSSIKYVAYTAYNQERVIMARVQYMDTLVVK